MRGHWEHFPHGADMGVRGFGATKAEAFAQAALAMTAVIADPATVEAREAVAVECEAPDDELLLAEWLNSVVYEMATRRMLFSRFEVQFAGFTGSPGRPGASRSTRRDIIRRWRSRARPIPTLRVAPESDGWVAQTVVDV